MQAPRRLADLRRPPCPLAVATDRLLHRTRDDWGLGPVAAPDPAARPAVTDPGVDPAAARP